jgi:hypothetical protein
MRATFEGDPDRLRPRKNAAATRSRSHGTPADVAVRHADDLRISVQTARDKHLEAKSGGPGTVISSTELASARIIGSKGLPEPVRMRLRTTDHESTTLMES